MHEGQISSHNSTDGVMKEIGCVDASLTLGCQQMSFVAPWDGLWNTSFEHFGRCLEDLNGTFLIVINYKGVIPPFVRDQYLHILSADNFQPLMIVEFEESIDNDTPLSGTDRKFIPGVQQDRIIEASLDCVG